MSTYPSLINHVCLLVKNTWAQTTETYREPAADVTHLAMHVEF